MSLLGQKKLEHLKQTSKQKKKEENMKLRFWQNSQSVYNCFHKGSLGNT